MEKIFTLKNKKANFTIEALNTKIKEKINFAFVAGTLL
jgi:hypothetical protein